MKREGAVAEGGYGRGPQRGSSGPGGCGGALEGCGVGMEGAWRAVIREMNDAYDAALIGDV